MSGRKMGRPPKKPGEAKGVMFCIRLTAEEKARIDAAAKAASMAPSEWARALLNRASDVDAR